MYVFNLYPYAYYSVWQVTPPSFFFQSLSDHHRVFQSLNKPLHLQDISCRSHTYKVGDQLHVENGQHTGSGSTIIDKNWDGSLLICQALLQSEDIKNWKNSNMYPLPEFPYVPGWPLKSKPVNSSLCFTAFPEQVVYLDPTKNLALHSGRDFLVGKRVMVQGVDYFKGMKENIISVNIAQFTAQVAFNATALISNRLQTVCLTHLLLDMSNDR